MMPKVGEKTFLGNGAETGQRPRVVFWREKPEPHYLFFPPSSTGDRHAWPYCSPLYFLIMTDPVEEAAKLPLSQRIEHSHWKVRCVAYEELAKKFSEAEDSNSGIFNEYGMSWPTQGIFVAKSFCVVGEDPS